MTKLRCPRLKWKLIAPAVYTNAVHFFICSIVYFALSRYQMKRHEYHSHHT